MPRMKSTDNLAPLGPIYCSILKTSYLSCEANADLCLVGKGIPAFHAPIFVHGNMVTGNGRFAKGEKESILAELQALTTCTGMSRRVYTGCLSRAQGQGE